MALRGNLRDFSLPDVFQLVTFSRKTGVLRIMRADNAEGSVWFREGDVFFASSNWHTEPLGQRLVTAQRITPQALSKALEIRAREGASGKRLGQILIDEGYITEKVLESFVSEQIQDTIFDLMRWDDGDFDFEAMPEIVDEDIGLTVSIENVVMEGSRRLEEWSRIKKKIPSTDVVFKMATAPGEGTFEIALKPIEWQLLLLIDATRSVADLATETGRTDFEVARIIYGLFSAGLLEFATDEEIKRNRVEREQREAKLAQIEEEKRRKEEASRAAAIQREAALAADASKRQRESEEANRAVEQAPVISQESEQEPVEEPEFLAGGTVAPTLEDQSALDEFMGAVLSVPASPAVETPPEFVEAISPTAPHVPAEEPAFISAGAHDDPDAGPVQVTSAEELFGIAQLSEPVSPDSEPERSAEDHVLAQQPQPQQELEPQPMLEPEPEQIAPVEIDFERDLMALGLGELPSDLLEPMGGGSEPMAFFEPPVFGEPTATSGGVEPLSYEDAPVELPEYHLADEDSEPPVAPPMSESDLWSESVAAASGFSMPEQSPALEYDFELSTESDDDGSAGVIIPDEPMDFSALIESLDVDADDSGSLAPSAGFDADLLRDEATALAGGVISTDAFLEDIGIEELGFSGGLNDELSALTGAERRQPARPQASVNALPDEGAGLLRRDARVDKDTLLKIIDGIKKL